MNDLFYSISLCVVCCLMACGGASKEDKQSNKETVTAVTNQENAHPGSDSMAVTIAKEVLKAHGGQEAWDNTRYISWNFLNSRDLLWDKYTGKVKISYPKENSEYRINIHTNTGQVKLNGQLIREEDSLKTYIERGRQIWVNDSYWLVFPFKLLDPGVILKYAGKDTTNAGQMAEVLALTFNEVGYTPQNKYLAYIDPTTHLIVQWDYFSDQSDTVASISQLWSDYDEYGEIVLSAGRGERDLSPIEIFDKMDSSVFHF